MPRNIICDFPLIAICTIYVLLEDIMRFYKVLIIGLFLTLSLSALGANREIAIFSTTDIHGRLFPYKIS
jgi:2',3'-cyclic-nucleotide 2'-phosphodiesterase (5'-nucleotidase family)